MNLPKLLNNINKNFPTNNKDLIDFHKSSLYTPKPNIKKKLSALLVEDNEVAQLAHKKILVAMGYAVDVASNAEAALMMLNNSYHLVLLDIILPDKNGIELAADIRHSKYNKQQLTIVGISAYATESIKNKCLGAGIDFLLSKPLNKCQLEKILHAKNHTPIFDSANDACLNDPTLAKKIRQQLLDEFYPAALKKAPKPDNMSESQYMNYLAIHILEGTGNEFPTQKAISFVESFLKRYHKKLSAAQALTKAETQPAKTKEIIYIQKKAIFTLKEAECSLLFLENKSPNIIAACLGMSLPATKKLLNNLKLKLHCNSYNELRTKIQERIS